MDNIKSCWILLSSNFTYCCNEQKYNRPDPVERMDNNLFDEIVKKADEYNWKCQVLSDKENLSKVVTKACSERNWEIYIPADYSGEVIPQNAVLVFDTNKANEFDIDENVSRAILRVHRKTLCDLSKTSINILEKCQNLSLYHPELLQYTQEDMNLLKDEMYKIAAWLLDRMQDWVGYKVNFLTSSFISKENLECCSGTEKFAISPSGDVYLCPAEVVDESKPFGNILKGIEVPNQHLFSREYSLPCNEKCSISTCLRCKYLSNLSTYEYCVPAENICKLSYYETEVQKWFSVEAQKRGMWNNELKTPSVPAVVDPYMLVKEEYERALEVDGWQRLLSFTGRLEDLTPGMMLDIAHDIGGTVSAIKGCCLKKERPSKSLLESDLVSVRSYALSRHKKTQIGNQGLTIEGIEKKLFEMLE